MSGGETHKHYCKTYIKHGFYLSQMENTDVFFSQVHNYEKFQGTVYCVIVD